MTDDEKAIAVTKAYGAQSIFLSKTGPLDYKPFCDKSLQFGMPEPERLLKERDEPLQPDVVIEPIEEEEVTPEAVDASTLEILPPVTIIRRFTDIGKIVFAAGMIDEPVLLVRSQAGLQAVPDSDGNIQFITYNKTLPSPVTQTLRLVGKNTGEIYTTKLMFILYEKN